MHSCGNRYKSMERSLIIMKLLLYKIVTLAHSQHSHPSAQQGGDMSLRSAPPGHSTLCTFSCGNRYSHPSAQTGGDMYCCGNRYKIMEKSLILMNKSVEEAVNTQHSHPSAQTGGDRYTCGNMYKNVEEAVTIHHSHPSAQPGGDMYSSAQPYQCTTRRGHV